MTPALRLQRADLVLIGRTLERLERRVHGEVSAARAAWPALVHGLPPNGTPATRVQISTASARSAALRTPAFVIREGALTGPAAGIGGLLKIYTALTQRGWRLIDAASDPAAGDGFLRANAGLYIYCVYDGHYDLSLIGEKLQRAYSALGGAPAFGPSLTQARVEHLAHAYSIDSIRLSPHPTRGVGV